MANIKAVSKKEVNQHIVLRPFNGVRRYERGEIVDASSWRLLPYLLENRYLTLVASVPVVQKSPKKDVVEDL